jgi:hypothetical protein
MASIDLSVRIPRGSPNHHLWNNNGTWFVHYTVHLPDYTKRRVRASLGTKTKDEARRRRDELFEKLKDPANSGGRN